MSDWKKYKLGDLGTFIGGVTSIKKEDYGHGFPFLQYINVYKNWKVDVNNLELMNVSKKELIRRNCKYGDIFFTASSETEDEVAMSSVLLAHIENLTFNGFCKRYRLYDFKTLLPEFARYLFRNKEFRGDVYQRVTGDVRFNISQKSLSEIIVKLPPLPEQRSIASVLSSLDDKIDLLHRQNKTLEHMAETLFRQWFVKEAKEDWEKRPLSSIATFLNGLACQKYPPKNDVDKLPVLKIKELRNGISKNSDWATNDVKSEYIINNGDVIFSWSASLMVKIWDGETCVLNQHLFKVSSFEFPKWYYYLWSKYYLDKFIAIAKAQATTMGHIKRKDLDNAMVLVPTNDELENMTKQIQPLIDKQIINSKQIRTLENMRDTLLPKLVSGEIKVKINE